MTTDPLHAASFPTAAGFREVPTAHAAPHVAAVRVIDVREPDEFNGPLGHVAGAQLVPLGTVASAITGWDRAAVYLLVCRSGVRSGRASAALAQAGFTRVYNLGGGMIAWNEAGLPVARD